MIARSGRIYKATTPLIGWEGVEQMMGESFPSKLAVHEMVIVEAGGKTAVYDFIPQNPGQFATILQLLSGNEVDGNARVRDISKVPTIRCELVGVAPMDCPHEVAIRFQQDWPKRLKLLSHDCRTHVAKLIEALV